MPLAVGARLGPYEVVSAVGAGGMGEVYAARDTRLNRRVAVKVLRDEISSEPGARARFDREAQTIASLHHPHICALHDVGHHDGMAFLVMEYLEGENLAVRLQRGRLPMDETLRLAVQILDALDHAHTLGIVHRDLKPGNVLLMRDGAKLLDFGLARLVEADGGSASAGVHAAEDPTAPPLTGHGAILGTLQYMAPEQVEGRPTDRRTDVFSFGVLLHEMITGKRAFEAKSQAGLIAAILDHQPAPITQMEPLAPPALERALAKCLAKDPEWRWQSTRDLRDELSWIADGRTATTAAPASTSRWRDGRVGWFVAALAVFIGAAATFALSNRRTATAPPLVLEVTTPPVTTTPNPAALSGMSAIVLSPDGRHLAYSGASTGRPQLWIRSLDLEVATPIAGTEDATEPFWSPDSRSLAFFLGSRLARFDLNGQLIRTVSDVGGTNRSGVWLPDDTIVYGGNSMPLRRVAAGGGVASDLTVLDSPNQNHLAPALLGDGRHIVYRVFGGGSASGVYVFALDDPRPRALLPGAARAFAAPPDSVLYLQGGTLFERQIRDGALLGQPIAVAQNVISASATSAGLLAYRRSPPPRQQQLTWFDRRGGILGTVGEVFTGNGMLELSPEGSRVALARNVAGNEDVYIMKLSDGAWTRLTFDAAADNRAAWSADGQTIVFNSSRSPSGFYQKPADGSAPDQLLLAGNDLSGAANSTPDGRFLLIRKNLSDFWILPMKPPGPPEPLIESTFDEANGQLSPDGRWIAYMSNEPGQYEIFVQAFRGARRWTVSSGGGSQPRWRADGHELFYVSPDNSLWAVPIAVSADGKTIVPGVPARLYGNATYSGFGPNFRVQYVVSADGQRILAGKPTDTPTFSTVTIVTNWRAGVHRARAGDRPQR